MKKKIIINSILFVLSIVGFVVLYTFNGINPTQILTYCLYDLLGIIIYLIPNVIIFYITGKNLLEILTK